MSETRPAGVFLLQENGTLVEMLEHPYDTEALLQRLLSQHPSLLAGSQVDPESPRKWLLIARECGIPGELNAADRWSIDHLFIDQDAIPTLVEVKRSSDTRIRREVVGQMLDYAANCILHWPIESLQQRFIDQCEMDKQVPADRLASFLGEDLTPEWFWQTVKTNLQAGKIRLLFVADQIPPELRRVVEFLNRQMDPAEVLAIEVRQYIGQGLKTLVPRVIGQTAEAEQKKGQAWDINTFMNTIRKNCGSQMADLAQLLYDWSLSALGGVEFGTGAQRGSFGPAVVNGSQARMFVVRSDGRVTIRFMDIKGKDRTKTQSILKQFMAKLNSIPGFDLAESNLNGKPNRSLEILFSPSHLRIFQDAVLWLREQLQGE